jgi:hypothetical protein
MSRSIFARLRLLGPVTAAAALGLGTLPALAQTTPMAPMTGDCSAIHFDLANPSAGSMIVPGGMVVQGIAMDSRATSGPGVDRVDFFLDSREQGGVNLGTAMPGVVPGPFGPDSFQTTVTIPNIMGGHDLFAYAHSSVSGAESVISVPVAIGEDPIKAGEQGATASETCMLGTASATSISTTPTTPMAPTTPTTPVTTTTTPATTTTTTTTTTTAVAPSASTITVDVSNPSPGDTIHAGGYVIDGVAFDKAAQSGAGIDRIEIFLDNRDSGGMFLTQVTPGADNMWHAIVPLPTNQTGLHTLYFYAHSSVTGQEAVVSIPVTIAP